MLEITVNAKQLILAIWTLLAILMSAVVVLGIGLQFWHVDDTPYLIVPAFFGIWLLIALPVYLLVAVWGMATPKSAEE